MDCNKMEISESDCEDVRMNTPLENELEEGEIEEDDDIFVLAEFERGDLKNRRKFDAPFPKKDIDERLPYITFTQNERKITFSTEKFSSRSTGYIQRPAFNRPDNRGSKFRNRRSPSSNVNLKKFSSRPQLRGYSLRRHSILKSIHRRTRSSYRSTSHSQSNNQSFDDLLAEYHDIKSKLEQLIYEEKNLKSEDENSNEESYGDKENRICRRNGAKWVSKFENTVNSSKLSATSSISSASPIPNGEIEAQKSEDEEDVLREIALASKFKCNKDSKLVATLVSEDSNNLPLTSANATEAVAPINSNENIDEEDEDVLRAQLLSSLTLKLEKSDVEDLPRSRPESPTKPDLNFGSKSLNEINTSTPVSQFSPALPIHKPLVINLNEDSDSECETSPLSTQEIASLDNIDNLLKGARNLTDNSNISAGLNAALQTTPLFVGRLSENGLKEYKILKAEIANREQCKRITKEEKVEAKKSNLSNAAKLKIAEEKFLKSRQLLSFEEKEYLKLNEQLMLHEKNLKTTESKIFNLEQQLNSAKKLEMLQKHRVAEMKLKKSNVEQKISTIKSGNLKYQRFCLGLGKRVQGNKYCLPGLSDNVKKLSPKILPLERQLKSSVKKIRSRKISAITSQGTNKFANELALEKIKLQKKQQELISKLAELRKQTLKASTIKSTVTKSTSTVQNLQSFKRIRKLSISKKSKKPRVSQSETGTKELLAEPGLDALCLKLELDKNFELENTQTTSNYTFEFHHFFTNEVPKLETENSSQVFIQSTNIIPESFSPYCSPLLKFRSYRFSPYFRTKSNQNLSWSTYTNGIRPKVTVCHYDLNGKCNDDKCKWQHKANYIISSEVCLKDILLYAPQMIESPANDLKLNKSDSFISNLINCNQDRMTLDEMCVLLVGRINEFLNKVPPHFITFDGQRLQHYANDNLGFSNDPFTLDLKNKEFDREGTRWHLKVNCDSDDICDDSDTRYFEYETQGSDLPQSTDEFGWISLARRKLNTIGCDSALSLDMTLDILSRALEMHSHSVNLWTFYLNLYSKRKDCSDLLNLYRQAVTLIPNYEIWFQYLEHTNNYEAKEGICEEILKYSLECVSDVELKSHQILEIILYWTKLNVLTGHFERAVIILEGTLHRNNEQSIASVHRVFEHMTSNDRSLIWLCYISLTVFHSLPNVMFSSENSGLGKVVCKQPFILPWHQSSKWHQSVGVVLKLFMDALRKCVLKGNSAKSNAQLCLPLYQNLIALELSRQRVNPVHKISGLEYANRISVSTLISRYFTLNFRNQSAIKVCEQLKRINLDEAWVTQVCVFYQMRNFRDLRKILHAALSGNANSSVLFCFAIMFELKQKNREDATNLCRQFVRSLVSQELYQHIEDLDTIFRHLLEFSIDDKILIKSQATFGELQSQNVYVWLIYCMYLISQDKISDVRNVFETAILRLKDRNDLQILWLHYLDICLCDSISLSKLISLITRCFNSVPCKVVMPGCNGDITYVSYAFFNLILDKYISPLEIDTQILIYERFISFAPNNSRLMIRLLILYTSQGENQVAWRLCCAQLERTPRNLELWKIALQLAYKNKSLSDIREIYKQGVEALPYSEFLWREYVAFETTRGERQYVEDLIKKSQEYGINLSTCT